MFKLRALAVLDAVRNPLLATLLVLVPSLATAQMTVQQARMIAEEIAHRVESQYVFAEKRPQITSMLRKALKQGQYDLTNPIQLAEHLTEDLNAASHDKHMWVSYDPPSHRALLENKAERPNRSLAAAAARKRNQGFEELRILPGNIRYVRITNFLWTAGVTPGVIDEVARFLGEGDGVLVDLRDNGGGNAESVERLISYFLPPTQRTLMTFVDSGSKTVEVGRTTVKLPHPRMVGIPLYVLINGGTGSAAEEFAYQVASFKLGVLIGETTAGAANNNELIPLQPGFVFSISTGRPVHPVTHTNWEGVGVQPNITAAYTMALDEAHLHLLHLLGEKMPKSRAHYDWWAQRVDARLHPVRVGAQQLKNYVGRYGIRTISAKDGVLIFQREGREPKALIPLGPDLFAFPDSDLVRLRFRRSGDRIIGFDQITIDGDSTPSDRTD